MKYDDVYRLKLELLVKDAITKYKSFTGTIKETFPTGLMRGEKGRFVSGKDIKLLKDQVNIANKLRDTHTQITHQAMTYGQRLGNAVRQAFSLELALRRISFVMVATFSWKVWYGLLRGLSDIGKVAVKFEHTMSKVSTMLEKKTMPLLKGFAIEIRKTALKYGEDLKVLGDTLYDILSARMPADWAPLVMEEAAKLATAGFTDTRTALKPLLTLMKSYHGTIKDVTKYSNIMTGTVAYARITFEDYAEQIGKVIPQAAILGISAEKIAAAYAIVTQQLGNARESATALRRLMLVFGKDNDKLNDIAIKYNVTLRDLINREDGFAYVMGRLADATNKEKIAVAGSVRAFSALASIASNVAGYMEALTGIQKGTYTTQDNLNKVIDDAAIKVKQMKASWKEFALSFNTLVLPVIKVAVDTLNILLSTLGGITKAILSIPDILINVKVTETIDEALIPDWSKIVYEYDEFGRKIGYHFAEAVEEGIEKGIEKTSLFEEFFREEDYRKYLSNLGLTVKEITSKIKTAIAEAKMVTPEEFKDVFKTLDKLRDAGVDTVSVQKEINELWRGVITHAENKLRLDKEALELAKKKGKGEEEANKRVRESYRELQLWKAEAAADEEKQKVKLYDLAVKDFELAKKRFETLQSYGITSIKLYNNMIIALDKAIDLHTTEAQYLELMAKRMKLLKIRSDEVAVSMSKIELPLRVKLFWEKFVKEIEEFKTAWEKTVEEIIPAINDAIQRFANMWSKYTQLRLSQARAESDGVISELDRQEESEIAYAERIGLGTEKIRAKYRKLRDKAEDEAQKKADKIRKAQKPIMIAQSIADTALAVVRALQTKPTWLGIALASTVGIIGAAQTAIIASQKFFKGGLVKTGNAIKAAFGGLIPGTGNNDTVSALLTPGEFVINPKATAQFYPLLKAINEFKTVAVPSITPSLAGGGVVTNNIFDNRLFEEFKEMKEAFLDIGFEEMKDGDYGHFVTKGTKFNRKSVFQ